MGRNELWMQAASAALAFVGESADTYVAADLADELLEEHDKRFGRDGVTGPQAESAELVASMLRSARNDSLEAAASECEAEVHYGSAAVACELIAARIRALKTKAAT